MLHFQKVLDVLQVGTLLSDSLSVRLSCTPQGVWAEEQQQGYSHHTKDGINLMMEEEIKS